ncbi:DUF6441 family protein [Pseudorhodobacter sp.]|uniref:DUF6441 family protein n=1 Tax=Pseudorhodobacter sp. TaxID=1934400 RepID=UPI002648240A|nr:DUF6441 family protein [Pseudorhodobacter sp.]MDN5786913.1 DUF6441 family protein [Pseudorhodobacter sp.]
MKLLVTIQNDLPRFMKGQIDVGARAVTAGVAGATLDLKTAWRGQITSAGLGNKLAGSIRSQVFPKGKASPNAAGLVWSKAPKLISAHNTGPLIRSSDGFWLAIPLPAAGKGARGAKITPLQWERRTGKRLRFVFRKGNTALLVADDSRENKRRLAVNKGGKRRKDGILTGAATIPIFVLVPQVKLRKRLDLDAVARSQAAGLPARIRSAWKRQM